MNVYESWIFRWMNYTVAVVETKYYGNKLIMYYYAQGHQESQCPSVPTVCPECDRKDIPRAQVSFFAPCKGIQDSLGFWIPSRWFRIPGSGFQSVSVEFGFWIPIVSRIQHSTGKNVPGSGIRISLHGATLGEYLLRLHEYIFQRPTKVHEPVGPWSLRNLRIQVPIYSKLDEKNDVINWLIYSNLSFTERFKFVFRLSDQYVDTMYRSIFCNKFIGFDLNPFRCLPILIQWMETARECYHIVCGHRSGVPRLRYGNCDFNSVD